ncbi:conserved hypothetical protein [Vibrio coralliirubri]|uniref:Uncharacterized protein n=1 Tax=Vibrio coralliirubri TaxID=1516159 RepID=A0AA86XSG4_9VIBR|nr:conserved hypothetical protein [Vibrio coralliirubri]
MVNGFVGAFAAHFDICNVIQALESGRYELGGCLKGRNECIYSHVYAVVYAGLECFNNVKIESTFAMWSEIKNFS